MRKMCRGKEYEEAGGVRTWALQLRVPRQEKRLVSPYHCRPRQVVYGHPSYRLKLGEACGLALL